jgi:hypothetical protein
MSNTATIPMSQQPFNLRLKLIDFALKQGATVVSIAIFTWVFYADNQTLKNEVKQSNAEIVELYKTQLTITQKTLIENQQIVQKNTEALDRNNAIFKLLMEQKIGRK